MSLYDGDTTDFCAQGVGVFSDVRYLLEQQYNRPSHLEKQLMYWLAIEREAIHINELRANLVPPVSKAQVLEALCSLRWRSLIEKGSSGFSQQPIVMEYMTEQLIEQVSQSLINGDLSLVLTYALIKRQAEPYIRQMQIKQIVLPILQRLLSHFGNQHSQTESYLEMLQEQMSQQYGSFGYGYHNLTVLLQQLRNETRILTHEMSNHGDWELSTTLSTNFSPNYGSTYASNQLHNYSGANYLGTYANTNSFCPNSSYPSHILNEEPSELQDQGSQNQVFQNEMPKQYYA